MNVESSGGSSPAATSRSCERSRALRARAIAASDGTSIGAMVTFSMRWKLRRRLSSAGVTKLIA